MRTNSEHKAERIVLQERIDYLSPSPFKRIVVGFESADVGDTALVMASTLAHTFDSRLHLVNSLPLVPPTAPLSLYVPPDLLEHNRINAKHDLQKQIIETGLFTDVTCDLTVSFEDPVDLILKVAREQDADLIVVGSHGRHGFNALVLGSISESILERAQCPVLILGPECDAFEISAQAILFATDLEYTGTQAAEYASMLASATNSKVIALHVLKEKAPAQGRQREWVEDHAREALRRLLIIDGHVPLQSETVIAYGDPVQEILACADLKKAGLIVLGVGRHGAMSDHSPWRTLTQIMQAARCPVLNVAGRPK